MINITLYIVIGLAAGMLSGLLGIGGAVVIVPVLIYLFGLSQHMAQGTTLALMLPPIGLLAALTYYRQGYVNWKIAAFVCVGFFIGGLFGARAAVGLNPEVLRKVFGVAMFLVSIHMIFFK
jgi:hypothetical protein